MINVEIKTIPHKKQRYDTAGDYFNKKGKDCFRISDCKDRNYEFLLALHEFIEKFCCDHAGITNKQIDEFDFSFKGNGEPGDSLEAPYHEQHMFASRIEKIACEFLGLDWNAYDEFVGNLK